MRSFQKEFVYAQIGLYTSILDPRQCNCPFNSYCEISDTDCVLLSDKILRIRTAFVWGIVYFTPVLDLKQLNQIYKNKYWTKFSDTMIKYDDKSMVIKYYNKTRIWNLQTKVNYERMGFLSQVRVQERVTV